MDAKSNEFGSDGIKPGPVTKWNPADLTDTDLMNEFTAAGGRDDKSLNALVIRHAGLVLNVVRKTGVRGSDADEVAADVWVKVMRMAERGAWDPSRAVHTTDPFVPLLKRIAKNAASDFHRKANRHHRSIGRLKEAADRYGADWRMDPSATPRRDRRQAAPKTGVPEMLQAAVAALPENLRRAYELHANGRSCRAVAKELGCSGATANRRVRAAVRLIRDRLGADPREG